MTRALYTCRCGKDFTARTADRKRGWALFCSKSCKAYEQESRTGQYAALKARVAESQDDADLDFDGSWDAHKE
jgi:hypothetical protein